MVQIIQYSPPYILVNLTTNKNKIHVGYHIICSLNDNPMMSANFSSNICVCCHLKSSPFINKNIKFFRKMLMSSLGY